MGTLDRAGGSALGRATGGIVMNIGTSRITVGLGILGLVGAGLLHGCNPGVNVSPYGDQIIGVSATMGFLVVTKQGADGALRACIYENSFQPGDVYKPRGCQALPPQ